MVARQNDEADVITVQYTREEAEAVERALGRIDNTVPASAQYNFTAYGHFINERSKYAVPNRGALEKTRAALKGKANDG